MSLKGDMKELLFSRNQWEEFKFSFNDLKTAFTMSQQQYLSDIEAQKAEHDRHRKSIDDLKIEILDTNKKIYEKHSEFQGYKLNQAEGIRMLESDMHQHLFK